MKTILDNTYVILRTYFDIYYIICTFIQANIVSHVYYVIVVIVIIMYLQCAQPEVTCGLVGLLFFAAIYWLLDNLDKSVVAC